MAENRVHERLTHDAEAQLLHFAWPIPVPTAASPMCAPPAGDLARLFGAAALHGVLPAALSGIEPLVPTDDERYRPVLAEAHTNLRYATAMCLLLTHHAARVMKALRAAGIEGAIVKGETFARRIYPQAWLRTFTDIDVLISPAHRVKAGEIMQELGFAAVGWTDRAGKDYAEDKWHLAGPMGVDAELHTNLVHSPKLRRGLSVGYAEVLEAGAGNPEGAEALLLIAAAHGAIGHQFERLQHVVDVGLIASGSAGPIDVARLRKVAERCGAAKAVATALDIADRVFLHPAIGELVEAFGHSSLNPLARLLITRKSVVRTHAPDRAMRGWRRKLFRQLQRVGGNPLLNLSRFVAITAPTVDKSSPTLSSKTGVAATAAASASKRFN